MKDNFFQQAGKGLAGATHREPEHFVMALRAPAPRLLPLTAGSVPPPALPMPRSPSSAQPGVSHPGCCPQVLRQRRRVPWHCLCPGCPQLLPRPSLQSSAAPAAPSSEQPWTRAAAGLVPGRYIKSGWCRAGGERSLGPHAPDFLGMQ